MFNINLSNGFVNAVLKGVVRKYLTKKLGTSAKIQLDGFEVIEQDGRLKIKANIDIDVPKENIFNLIGL